METGAANILGKNTSFIYGQIGFFEPSRTFAETFKAKFYVGVSNLETFEKLALLL